MSLALAEATSMASRVLSSLRTWSMFWGKIRTVRGKWNEAQVWLVGRCVSLHVTQSTGRPPDVASTIPAARSSPRHTARADNVPAREDYDTSTDCGGSFRALLSAVLSARRTETGAVHRTNARRDGTPTRRAATALVPRWGCAHSVWRRIAEKIVPVHYQMGCVSSSVSEDTVRLLPQNPWLALDPAQLHGTPEAPAAERIGGGSQEETRPEREGTSKAPAGSQPFLEYLDAHGIQRPSCAPFPPLP